MNPRVAIVGAGMSGLCMAARLKQAGIESFTIHEKADRLGGTWRENTYPGLTCDVPSRFYQFSFAPNPDWSQLFSTGEEIWRYFDRFANENGLRQHIRFGSEVVSARYEDSGWSIETADGLRERADFLVNACGVLHHPRVPEIPGIDAFAGSAFHSARWDHEMPVQGKRIAVVGTGSTGVQIICALAGVAAEVKLFQRTAQWVAPVPNHRYSRLLSGAQRRLPGLGRLSYHGNRFVFELFAGALTKPGLRRRLIAALCRLNLRTVRDPELRRRLTPDYEPMCKRLVVSSGFYRAMQRPDVALVTDDIDHVERKGIVTRDGTMHEVDAIVLATGFDAHAYVRPMKLTGRDGVTLEEAWAEGPHAYLTVALPGFPNHFMLMGPHSPVGNYSLTAVAESQVEHAMGWIERWRAGEIASVAPTPEATERCNAEMRAAMPDTVWVTGCNSWYLGEDGLPTVWPWTPDRHRKMLCAARLEDFEIESVTDRTPIGAAG